MLASFEKLKTLESKGAKIYYGHDPEFWQSLPQFPEAVISG
jgi:hypothetical protein